MAQIPLDSLRFEPNSPLFTVKSALGPVFSHFYRSITAISPVWPHIFPLLLAKYRSKGLKKANFLLFWPKISEKWHIFPLYYVKKMKNCTFPGKNWTFYPKKETFLWKIEHFVKKLLFSVQLEKIEYFYFWSGFTYKKEKL